MDNLQLADTAEQAGMLAAGTPAVAEMLSAVQVGILVVGNRVADRLLWASHSRRRTGLPPHQHRNLDRTPCSTQFLELS